MNRKKKLYPSSPFPKYKSKRINSKQKKIIEGKFVAEVNIKDVCDETSEEDSWITESETSRTTGNDDVFISTTTAASGSEEIYSPTESLRRTDNNEDNWSLSHIREDPVDYLEKGAAGDIVPSPKICLRSDSEESQRTSNRIVSPKMLPASPYIEEMKDFLFDENSYPESDSHSKTEKNSKFLEKDSEKDRKRILFDSTRIVDPKIGTDVPLHFEECNVSSISDSTQSNQHVSTKKLKLPEKRILPEEFSGESSVPKVQRTASKAVNFKSGISEINTPKTPSSFEKGPSNMHSLIQKKNLIKQGNRKETLCDTPKGSADHTFPKRKIFLQENSRTKTTEEIASNLGPCNKDNLKECFSGKYISRTPPEILDSTYVIVTKESELTPFASICADNAGKSTEDGNQFKKAANSELTDKKKLDKTGARQDSLKEKSCSQDDLTVQTEAIIVTESVESSKTPTKSSKEHEAESSEAIFTKSKDGNQSKETADSELLKKKKFHEKEASRDSLKEKSLSPVPLSVQTGSVIAAESVESSETPTKTAKEHEAKSSKATFTKSNDGKQFKKTAGSKLLKKKKLHKTDASQDILKEKSLSEASLTLEIEDKNPTESVESSRAPSTKDSKVYETKSTEALIIDGHKTKETSAATVKKKNPHKRKENFLKKKHLSADTSSASAKGSILDFIVSTEDEESTEKHSSKISEKHSQSNLNASEDSWKSYLSSKKKRKETSLKIQETLEELEEEIASTSSSTTINEDSVGYMDTSETDASSKTSENTKKFLKDVGLYDSEQSTEAESSKLKKRRKNLKKKSRKDSSEEKSLEVRLQEYKAYLETLPFCDLSLKKWRDKKKKRGV